MRLLRCEYPVDDLLSALEERRRPLPLRDRPAAEHVHLVVHRSDNELFFKRVGAAEFRVLQALQRGANLGDAALLGRDPDRVRALFELAASLRWFARPPKA